MVVYSGDTTCPMDFVIWQYAEIWHSDSFRLAVPVVGPCIVLVPLSVGVFAGILKPVQPRQFFNDLQVIRRKIPSLVDYRGDVFTESINLPQKRYEKAICLFGLMPAPQRC